MWSTLWAFLRPYLAAVVLAVAGVVFVLGWLFDGDAGIAVGAALLAAGFTHAVDVERQQRADTAKARAEELDRRRRDLDETRRLLYMLGANMRHADPPLEATVINALVHHGMGVPFEEARQNVVLPTRKWSWMERQIAAIGRELDELASAR